MDVAYILSIFVGILAIVNPFGNISFFTSLTQGFSVAEKKQVISKAVVAATLTLLVFGLLGSYIFKLFSITIPAFRIAGGLLLFRVAFSMLYGSTPGTKSTTEEKEESLEREMVGVIPMAIPMLAGPGAISTVMLYVSEGNLNELLVVFISIFVTMFITFILLRNADKIFSKIGRVGSLAISRIMGLILAAVAVQFLVNGIHDIALAWITEFSSLFVNGVITSFFF
ncbi:MAG: MarC family protein [Candidatus Thermoplasmatota archaeon]|nr:MarC family protein [Candidatus Thermoplasmatota archaeon]MBS3801346.1 MarC family protein [Candidatus Thermoplasmatota archaeon]